MTYVSRRTRIIVSRWTDECDADYSLKACRKRSDGRLKRHSSCDDLRAWIRDDHIKNEYLVDLMSDGEFLGKPPFRLYGRFIPVPILFKLGPNLTVENTGAEYNENQEKNIDKTNRSAGKDLKKTSNSVNKDSKLKGDSSLTRILWEKNLLEKHLVKCACLLNVAFEKLEKIDLIVSLANQEIENARNEEIQEAFYKSKISCTCSQHQSSSAYSGLNNFSENVSSSQSNLKELREATKCNELLRKISGLRGKLKKIQERRQEILFQIRASKQKADRCPSSHQVTELFSRREQAQVKKLQDKYQKLISERGRILYEICEALTALNALKKTSKSSVKTQRKRPKSGLNCIAYRSEEFGDSINCDCGCKCIEVFESTDSEKLQCSESSSVDSELNKKFENLKQMDKNLCLTLKNYAEFPLRRSADCGNLDLEQLCGDNLNSAVSTDAPHRCSVLTSSSTDKSVKEDKKLSLARQKKSEKTQEKKGGTKIAKKSKVKFICEESFCRKKFYTDDLLAFENFLSPKQQLVIQKAVENVRHIQSLRPNTSPTTKREKQTACLESKPLCRNASVEQSYQPLETIPERRVKSEMTMKEIEKTLRNYEQRLSDMDSLECKVEDLKEKSSEASRLRKKLAKVKAEAKKQRANDKEKSNREITRLCSENWELKKQIQQLIAKFGAQNQKIQNLKCSVLKARELECEAQRLKKELSECRDSFEHHRKCISKWESVVAMQRTEIENLMNHIRKLTAMKEEAFCSSFHDKRYIQRSRSYSPEKIRERVSINRPKTQAQTSKHSSEEEEICYCRDYRQLEARKKIQLMTFDRRNCSPIREHRNWCN